MRNASRLRSPSPLGGELRGGNELLENISKTLAAYKERVGFGTVCMPTVKNPESLVDADRGSLV
jgi:hypothetical protein